MTAISRLRPDLHPDDTAARRALAAALRDARTRAGIRQVDVAAPLGLTHYSISRIEKDPRPNPLISTVQRHARAVGHRLHLDLAGLPDADLGTHGDLLGRLTRVADPDMADAARRSLVMARLVAARHALGLRLQDVAPVMQVTDTALCGFELERFDPLLSTYQRYARALGGRLVAELVAVEREVAA